jgi:stress response protein SCP2
MLLKKGQRVKVSQIDAGPVFEVGITMNLSGPGEIGGCCFCLDASGGLAEARWLVYEGNPESPDGAIKYTGAARGDSHGFEVALGKIPGTVAKVVFVAFVNGPGALNQLAYGHLRVKDGDSELARYVMSGHDFAHEKAVMAAELYRKDGEWRLYVNCQGFAEGIEGIFRHFRAGELWEAIAGAELARETTTIVVSPEQAREILEVLSRPAGREYQDDDPWPSQDDGSGAGYEAEPGPGLTGPHAPGGKPTQH